MSIEPVEALAVTTPVIDIKIKAATKCANTRKKPFHTESPFGNWLPALFQGGRPIALRRHLSVGLLLSFEMLSTTAASFTDIDCIIFYYLHYIPFFAFVNRKIRKKSEKSNKNYGVQTDGRKRWQALHTGHERTCVFCIKNKEEKADSFALL